MTQDRAAAVATALIAILMRQLRNPTMRDEITTVLREEFEEIARQVRNELRSD